VTPNPENRFVPKLKIVQAGWGGFTGHFGSVEFQDGVSVESLDRRQIDFLAGIVSCEIVNEDPGQPNEVAGIAHRLIGGAAIPLEVLEPLPRATDAEIAAEMKAEMNKRGIPPTQEFFTKEQLEAIAEKEGIEALRKIAKPWNVRDRKISNLIIEILKAQSEHQARKKQLEAEQKRLGEKASAESAADAVAQTAKIDAQARDLQREEAEKKIKDEAKAAVEAADKARVEAEVRAEAEKLAAEAAAAKAAETNTDVAEAEAVAEAAAEAVAEVAQETEQAADEPAADPVATDEPVAEPVEDEAR
jgi:hypothetical protein